jgi:nucleoside-diphosphate-sugar epimerase
MKQFLITGVNSGLGKYLLNALPNAVGLNRDNFNLLKKYDYDTILHCAFNKENIITDYKKYLDDNIFLTQRLKKLNYSKFVYISTVDVYQEEPTIYAHFKKFSETLMDDKDLILRCSMMLGNTMKPNHTAKLLNNEPSIGLSGESKFNYILMEDLAEFFNNGDYKHYSGAVDFVSNDLVKLEDVKNLFNSTTKLGEHIYKNNLEFENPIFNLNKKYNKSSFENLKKYYGV